MFDRLILLMVFCYALWYVPGVKEVLFMWFKLICEKILK